MDNTQQGAFLKIKKNLREPLKTDEDRASKEVTVLCVQEKVTGLLCVQKKVKVCQQYMFPTPRAVAIFEIKFILIITI